MAEDRCSILNNNSNANILFRTRTCTIVYNLSKHINNTFIHLIASWSLCKADWFPWWWSLCDQNLQSVQFKDVFIFSKGPGTPPSFRCYSRELNLSLGLLPLSKLVVLQFKGLPYIISELLNIYRHTHNKIKWNI